MFCGGTPIIDYLGTNKKPVWVCLIIPCAKHQETKRPTSASAKNAASRAALPNPLMKVKLENPQRTEQLPKMPLTVAQFQNKQNHEIENPQFDDQRNDTSTANAHASGMVELEKQKDADQLERSPNRQRHASGTTNWKFKKMLTNYSTRQLWASGFVNWRNKKMLTNWNDAPTANPHASGMVKLKNDNLMTNSPRPSLPGEAS